MDDSDFVEKSLKSTSEHKCKSGSEIISKPVIRSDYLLPGGDKDKCFVCNKDLKHLDELRKSLHINCCLDQQETCEKYKTRKKEWKKVVDCPICGEPLESGPFRATHVKRCGKKHHVNPNSLLLLLDTQTKVAEAKKRNGAAHTKQGQPKLETKKRPIRLNEEPRSLFDEQMKLGKALSASMCPSESKMYTETHEPPQKLPKMKSEKRRPRSFSFVELEPRVCKCEVIEKIQENFLNIFKTRDEEDMRTILKKNIQDTEEILKNAGVCLRKLNSLKQLADDLASFTENNSDVIVFSRENETFLVCQFIIAARAPALLQHLNQDGSLKLREYSGAAVRSYMAFLTSASIIWTENEREEVHSMAVKYGPKGLAALCKSTKLEVCFKKETVEHYPEIDVSGNCNGMEKVPNVKTTEEMEEGRCFSDAKLRVCGGEKEETKNRDPEFVNSEGNEFIGGSPNLLRYSLSKCKKSSVDEKSEILEKGIAEFAKQDNSFLLGDRVDNYVPLSSSPLPPCASPNLIVMDHLNDSIESLLKKLSPIKPLPSCDGFSLPTACCSRQAASDNLSGNSPGKLLTSPSSRNKKSEESLITKTSLDFSFIPKKSTHLLSSLSLLDRSSLPHKNVVSSPEKKRVRAEAFIHQEASTPEVSTNRHVQRLEELGTDVKILKTKDITPMPVYDLMNDKELKTELAKFGIRPMGKKRAVALLKKIYHETHPVLASTPSTPLSRKSKTTLNSNRQVKTKENVEPCSDEDSDGDKTLNTSLDEHKIMEESCMNEEQSALLPKDLEGMQSVLLNWLRREENSSLYNHLLGLNVVPFEEFANRVSHADSTVSQIPKKALVEILDRLHVTFRMPMDGWDRKRRRARR
ncbi:hypothetical protein LOAG_00926 [Loa loa]|uniref:Uncharacterized protein n=1 Tax=Loa loa TaxID=7209 RepID=A0A1S0UAM7_LOALO|nr:hypothetical protein LOAG_00926 [Loa loa]EFO27562.2 hypothetical protein LOAG_00926 [Loa loa]